MLNFSGMPVLLIVPSYYAQYYAWPCDVCTRAVCEVMAFDSDAGSAIIELTQLTEPLCDHPQCPIQEKLKLPQKKIKNSKLY